MTHSPPVPPGNTSPYPLHEPVHADPLPRPLLAERADPEPPTLSTSAILASIAGLGALIATGAFYMLRGRQTPTGSGKNKRRRKTSGAA